MTPSSGDQDSPVARVLRVVGGVALFILGAMQLFRAFTRGDIFGLLIGAAMLSMAGGLLAPVLAGVIAEPAGRLFYPGRKLSRPEPTYSVAQARRAFGRYEEAIEELKKVSLEFPEEVQAWTEMLDIALLELKDGERALALYHEGMAVLPTPASREALGRTFQAMMARHRVRQAAEARSREPLIEVPAEWPPPPKNPDS